MPFTLAHPAAVLPFLRSRHVSATGLIVGSMIPDVEYFLTMSDQCNNVHTWKAVFVSYLPLTLLLSFIFHAFIKQSLIDNLPAFLQQRYGGIRSFNFLNYLRKNWHVFLYSALAGIALHFAWDSFTHGKGVFAYFPAFYSKRFVIFGRDYAMLMVLQYGSTLIGLLIMAVYLLKFDAKRIVSVTKVNLWYWTGIAFIAGMLMWVRIDIIHTSLTHRSILISLVSSVFIGLWFTGKLHRIRAVLKAYRIGRMLKRYEFTLITRPVRQVAKVIREEIPYYINRESGKLAEKQL